MEDERSDVSQMSTMDRFVNIFAAPREAFKSIDERPTWLFPFLIIVVLTLLIQYLTLDIQLSDQVEALKHRDLSEEQFEAQRNLMMGPMKTLGFVLAPIFIPIIWAALAGLIMLAAGMFLKGYSAGEGTFKKLYAMVAWSSLISLISAILLAMLIQSKGTAHGVSLDLSMLLPTPAVGESKSVFYRLMSKIDPFVFWQMFLWMTGLSVFYKADIKKAALPVLVLWLIWVVVSVAGGSMLGNLGF